MSGQGAAGPFAPSNAVRFVQPPADGDVSAIVKSELATAKPEGRTVLVYVGATWCEPCKEFHKAASKGELDATFPTLTLIEFDADRDDARLRSAGYRSKYIPLFAIPSDDGRSSGHQIEGSAQKGDKVVPGITERLKELLLK